MYICTTSTNEQSTSQRINQSTSTIALNTTNSNYQQHQTHTHTHTHISSLSDHWDHPQSWTTQTLSLLDACQQHWLPMLQLWSSYQLLTYQPPPHPPWPQCATKLIHIIAIKRAVVRFCSILATLHQYYCSMTIGVNIDNQSGLQSRQSSESLSNTVPYHWLATFIT